MQEALLRQALPHPDSYLESDVQTVLWRDDASFTLDVADFESALARADQAQQAGERDGVREALEQAVGQPCRVVGELSSQQASQAAAAPEPPPARKEASSAAREPSPAGRYRQAAQDPVIQAAVEELGAQVVDVSDT